MINNITRDKWNRYRLKWLFNRAYKKFFHKNLLHFDKTIGGVRVHNTEEAGHYIGNMLNCNMPFSVCRFGTVELSLLIDYLNDKYKKSDDLLTRDMIKSIFPNDSGGVIRKKAQDFIGVYFEAARAADILCTWTGQNMHDVVIDEIRPSYLTFGTAVEPYYQKYPWSAGLRNKRVLVISPFVDVIKRQYLSHRESLFDNPFILPNFELLTLKSVWFDRIGNDPRFKDWFEAYDYLYDSAMKMNFDVALLGCGHFGFPLATRFAKAGKQAIQVAGALQIMFGVFGKRWENIPNVRRLKKDNWVYPPLPDERFSLNINKLDEGCYWGDAT